MIKSKLNIFLEKLWINKWKSTPLYSHTKNFINKPDKKGAQIAANHNKYEIQIMTQMITGHSILRAHRAKMGHNIQDTCRGCEESTETPLHIITECPSTELIRLQSFIWHPGEHMSEYVAFLKGLFRFIKEPEAARFLEYEEVEGINESG